jgi:UDP-glucose 4-epimerase
VLDNFPTGRLENLTHLRETPNLKIHQVDIADDHSIRPHFDNVEWVFHLAALAWNSEDRYLHSGAWEACKED